MVSVVCSLHNEEAHIEQLIEAFVNSDYPQDKLEVLLGDDCSTDRTRELIEGLVGRGVPAPPKDNASASGAAGMPRPTGPKVEKNTESIIKLIPFDENIGKTAVVNQLVPMAQGDVVAFCDANTFYEPDALGKMVRHFADERVGTVCGRLILKSKTGANTDDQYWQYESTIKQIEGDFGVVLGANGGIYMLRKELFVPLEPSVIQIDDFIWPVKTQEQGCIGVYEPEAVANEEAAPFVEAEFRRKVRIGTGDYRALRDLWRILLPWKGMLSFCYWSHKVIRWLAPFILLAILGSNIALCSMPFFRAMLGLQVLFYISAALGKLVSRQTGVFARLMRLPYYFVGSNAALFMGFFKCATGRQKSTWATTGHR